MERDECKKNKFLRSISSETEKSSIERLRLSRVLSNTLTFSLNTFPPAGISDTDGGDTLHPRVGLSCTRLGLACNDV